MSLLNSIHFLLELLGLLHNIEVISEDFGKVEQVLDFQITTKDEDRDQIISCVCVTTSDEDELVKKNKK